MVEFRYAQFCPLARATEILGERWTLLIVRELLLGPRRFSDLEEPLPGISSSVLADRLGRLEERGVVHRQQLPRPASATVYELTESGRALRPVVVELVRWGSRFLGSPQPSEHLEPDWLRLGAHAFARRAATPARSFRVTVRGHGREATFVARGGPDGTAVEEDGPADLSISGDTLVVMGVVSGALDPAEAVRSGALQAHGDLDALVDFPALFEMNPQTETPDGTP